MVKEEHKTPALRFPEFSDEWELKAFNSFLTDRVEYPVDELPLYSLTIEGGVVPKTARYERGFLVKSQDKAYKVIHQYDFAYNPMNLRFGALAMHKEKMNVLVSKYYDIFYCNDDVVPEYIESYFTSYKMIQFYNKMATGSLEEKKRVHYSDFVNFKKPFPSKAEQQKIADFLSAVDRKVQQLGEKHRLLTEYKKGVLQQIFSQQIRFVDDSGQPYSDWEEKSLGDVLRFLPTNSLSRDKLNYEAGEVRNIHYGDIHTRFRANFHLDNEQVPFINEDVDLSRVADESYCQNGDLVVADASEDYKDIGKTIEIIDTHGEKILAGLHTYLARPDEKAVALGLLGYLMQTNHVRLQIMKLAQGISVLGISKGNIAKVIANIPCKEEQKKIADFLTSIDHKIDQVNTQLEQSQAFKKGLLQQMFV